MKTLVNTSLAMMAISLSGCSTVAAKRGTDEGRMIEYKSDASGFDTRTFFYEGKNEVVAFDSQFTAELARQSIVHLRKFTNKPITWLVVTHPNPDKFNGTSVFKEEGAKILASQATADAISSVHAYKEFYFVEMAKMFKKGDYPQPAAIDQTFEQQMDLVLGGGERIQLRELSRPGVSTNQTVAYIRSIASLVVGDLIHHQAHAWLEGGIVNGKPTPTIEGWLEDLMELSSLYPKEASVFGGRGVTADLKTSVAEQMKYLKIAQNLIRNELLSMGAKAKEFNGPKAGALYKSLADKFQATFPNYAFPYLIEYGAYGLAQAELQALFQHPRP